MDCYLAGPAAPDRPLSPPSPLQLPRRAQDGVPAARRLPGHAGQRGGAGQRQQALARAAPQQHGWVLLPENVPEKELNAAYSRTWEEVLLDLLTGRRAVPRLAAAFFRDLLAREGNNVAAALRPLGRNVAMANVLMWHWWAGQAAGRGTSGAAQRSAAQAVRRGLPDPPPLLCLTPALPTAAPPPAALPQDQ